ncbi:MAG: hypothetical protein PHH93_13385 [Prolixibacteraceae bacterium]|nr:hypothetical protein [Prolixibacteraceae bacterium]
MYKAIYMIGDHEYNINFNKVRAIEPSNVNPNDKLIYFDERDYFVHLSDIVMIVDNNGNKHTECILTLLANFEE